MTSGRASLRSTCGSFNPMVAQSGDAVLGAARRIDTCGMEFAHVSNDLDFVRATGMTFAAMLRSIYS